MLRNVKKIKLLRSGIKSVEASPMIDGRIQFGCCLNTKKREIYVVGGLINL